MNDIDKLKFKVRYYLDIKPADKKDLHIKMLEVIDEALAIGLQEGSKQVWREYD